MGKKRLEEIKVKSFVTTMEKNNFQGGIATDGCTVVGCSLFTGCLGCPQSERLQLCDPGPESDTPTCVPIRE